MACPVLSVPLRLCWGTLVVLIFLRAQRSMALACQYHIWEVGPRKTSWSMDSRSFSSGQVDLVNQQGHLSDSPWSPSWGIKGWESQCPTSTSYSQHFVTRFWEESCWWLDLWASPGLDHHLGVSPDLQHPKDAEPNNRIDGGVGADCGLVAPPHILPHIPPGLWPPPHSLLWSWEGLAESRTRQVSPTEQVFASFQCRLVWPPATALGALKVYSSDFF